MITKAQIKKIKTLQNRLGIPDKNYRLLLSDYWVNSCKQLTEKEANDFIGKLEEQAIAKGIWQQFNRKKYDNLGKRKGMASPKQLRLIEAIWERISWTHDEYKKEIALRKLLLRIAGVDDLVFLTNEGVRKVIEALKNIQKRRVHA